MDQHSRVPPWKRVGLPLPVWLCRLRKGLETRGAGEESDTERDRMMQHFFIVFVFLLKCFFSYTLRQK